MKDYIYKEINYEKGSLQLKSTLYKCKTPKPKGVLLYYHGGGLLYGHRKDLPDLHVDMITKSGYSILSFDYRLAPEASFHLILEDILDSIHFLISKRDELHFKDCPYFLWGRSAGAYLSLIACTKNSNIDPKGIISYYGYGFTIPNWYNTSSVHYLKYPRINERQALGIVQDEFISQADINKRFPLYLYGRQTGNWISIISKGNEGEFLKRYSLLNISKDFDFPPTFLAHSFKDEDVPFRESIQLSKIIKDSILFTCSADDHDFDRHEKDKNTLDLLNKTIEFLDSHIDTKH